MTAAYSTGEVTGLPGHGLSAIGCSAGLQP
jgi:hypothetical protein